MRARYVLAVVALAGAFAFSGGRPKDAVACDASCGTTCYWTTSYTCYSCGYGSSGLPWFTEERYEGLKINHHICPNGYHQDYWSGVKCGDCYKFGI
jgi:hypothetical protein